MSYQCPIYFFYAPFVHKLIVGCHSTICDFAHCSAEALSRHDKCSCSADILKDYGLEWVILGHSERRALMHETSEVTCCDRRLLPCED